MAREGRGHPHGFREKDSHDPASRRDCAAPGRDDLVDPIEDLVFERDLGAASRSSRASADVEPDDLLQAGADLCRSAAAWWIG